MTEPQKTPAPAPSVDDDDGAPDMREYLRALRRYAWLILLFVVASVGVAATIATVSALVLLVLLRADAKLTKGVYKASGLNKLVLAEPLFFLAANLLLCALLLQVLRRKGGRGISVGFPLDVSAGHGR